MSDEKIDITDIPPLDEAFFANAKVKLPPGKVPLVISVDADIMDWFRIQSGGEYQRLINTALRQYAESHKQSRG